MNDALKLAAKLRERYGATVPTSQAAAPTPPNADQKGQ